MVSNKILLVVSLLCLSSIQSCDFFNKKKNRDFYSYSKEFDLYRIPLVEPYEVVNVGFIEEPWSFGIPFMNSGIPEKELYIDGVLTKMKDSLILLHSSRTNVANRGTELWFVINLKEKKEYYYTDSLSFKESEYGNLKTISCSKTFEHYNATGNWIHLK